MNQDDMPPSAAPGESRDGEFRDPLWAVDWLDASATTGHVLQLPVSLTDDLVPLTEGGRYVPHHLDENGVAHWFSIVEVVNGANHDAEPYQLRYFRAARDNQGQIVHDSYPVMPLANDERSPAPLPTLQLMLEEGDLANAQWLAHGTAQLYELPFPEPTELGRLNSPGVAEARDHFAYSLLKPLDPTVNYSFEVMAADPWTLELSADKWWFDADHRVGHDRLVLATYSMEQSEFERDSERERASMDRETLYRTFREKGLEAAIHKAEEMALAQAELDPSRTDGRLFQQGPPDRFTTLREAVLNHAELPPADITPAEPGSWDELLQRESPDEPEVETHYWQLQIRPAVMPDGTPLGYSLFCTEFPQLPPDFDTYVSENGMDDLIYPNSSPNRRDGGLQN